MYSKGTDEREGDREHGLHLHKRGEVEGLRVSLANHRITLPCAILLYTEGFDPTDDGNCVYCVVPAVRNALSRPPYELLPIIR